MTTTKEQLLKYFSGLDVSVLQKLEKYSKLLIIPEEDLLINVTMSQMVEKAHSLADVLFPEWTDRSKSDFGEFLVELIALFSEKDFWYINAHANEGLLRKMKSYSNAFAKASALGYSPTLCKSASAVFEIKVSAGEEITYEAGDLVISAEGITFTNGESFTVSRADTPTTTLVTLYQGKQLVEDVTYNGNNIFLRKPNIDIDSIRVSIDGIAYSRVGNFGLSASDSPHFVVLPEEDGSCSVYFGADGFGAQPSLGKSIHVQYRTCDGSDGNSPLAQCTVTDSLSEREVIEVTMTSAAQNGTFADSLTSIKERAPMYFSTKKAAVNIQSVQSLLNNLSFVHKSKVVLLDRDVIYRIIPTSGYLEPTSEELTMLSREFDPYLMLGYNGLYSPNSYKNLLTEANPFADKIILDVVVSSGYALASVESSLRQVMDDITNPLIGADYGGSFNKTNVDILMRSRVPGVQNVSFKIKTGTSESIMPDVTLQEFEIFRTINQEDITVRINVV